MLNDKNIQNLLRHVKTELNKAIARGDDRSAIEWREAQIKIGKAINHGR